jgi:hypothetical protein
MMGVAEGVVDRVEGGVGAKVVVDHNPALKPRGNVAARATDPVDRMALARGRVQPLGLAGDAKAVLSIAEGSSRQRTLASATPIPIAR